jgi:hypothetical protein
VKKFLIDFDAPYTEHNREKRLDQDKIQVIRFTLKVEEFGNG